MPSKPSAPPSSDARSKRFDEDAPTQVDELADAIPRASAAPGPPVAISVGPLSTRPPASGGLPIGPASGSGRSETGSGDSSRGAGSSASSLVTARETLGYQEIQRTRSFMRVALGLAVIMSMALPFVGGDPVAKAIFFMGFSCLCEQE